MSLTNFSLSALLEASPTKLNNNPLQQQSPFQPTPTPNKIKINNPPENTTDPIHKQPTDLIITVIDCNDCTKIELYSCHKLVMARESELILTQLLTTGQLMNENNNNGRVHELKLDGIVTVEGFGNLYQAFYLGKILRLFWGS